MKKILIVIFLIIFLFYAPVINASSNMMSTDSLIIFIHGFNGDSVSSWTNNQTKENWPELIRKDKELQHFTAETYSYEAEFFKQGITTNELATRFMEFLTSRSDAYDNIYIIAYSFGGVISIDAIQRLSQFDNEAFKKIKAVFLIASPLRGVNLLNKGLQFLFPNSSIPDLRKFDINSYLQKIDNGFRVLKIDRTKTGEHVPLVYVTYETKKTKKFKVVDLNEIFPYHDDPIGAFPAEKNHLEISKPKDAKDEIYIWVKKRLLQIAVGVDLPNLVDIDTVLNKSEFYLDTQSRLSINEFNVKQLPPLRIFGEIPYSEFACFDYEIFRKIIDNKNEILFSNELSNPVVTLRFYIEKPKGNLIIYLDDIQFNPLNPKASFQNRLAFLQFQRMLIHNAKLVFWNLEEDKVLFRTGHALPTNLRYNPNIEFIRDIIQKIVNIERYFGIQLQYRTKFTESDIKTIAYIDDVLQGKEIKLGNSHTIHIKNIDEKRDFLSKMKPENYVGGFRYHYHLESEPITLFTSELDLGENLLKISDANFVPSLKEIEDDSFPLPITVQITSKDSTRDILLWHYKSPVKYKVD